MQTINVLRWSYDYEKHELRGKKVEQVQCYYCRAWVDKDDVVEIAISRSSDPFRAICSKCLLTH